MLIEPQIVETCFAPKTKAWYESLGYTWEKNKHVMIPVCDLPPGSSVNVQVKCDSCGKEFSKPYHSYIKNDMPRNYSMCSSCVMRKRWSSSYDDRAKEHMDKFFAKCEDNNIIPISTLQDYANTCSVLRFRCEKHGEISMPYVKFMATKQGCPKCGQHHGRKKLTIAEVISIVESKNNNRIVNPEEYIGVNEKNLRIICGSCGEEYITSLASIQRSSGKCFQCGCVNEKQLNIDEVEQRVNRVNNNLLLNKDEYVNANEGNLKIQCKCGNIFITSLSRYEYFNVNRCPVCTQRTSRGELMIASILDELHIVYDPEHRFTDCKAKRPLPFDFYLPEYNAIIEFDGPHHYEPIFGVEHLKKTQKHDKIKNKYCEDNNINLIRIPYWERDNIQTIITQGLGLDIDKTA